MGTDLVVVGAKKVDGRASNGKKPFVWETWMEEEIIDGLLQGVTMVELCKREGMPSYTTVWHHGEADPDFKKRVRRAREEGCHYLADQCLIVAHTPVTGDITTFHSDGTIDIKREDAIAHRRLIIDTHMRLIGKLNHYYNDKKVVQLEGPGGGPVQTIHREMSAKEAAELFADTMREAPE